MSESNLERGLGNVCLGQDHVFNFGNMLLKDRDDAVKQRDRRRWTTAASTEKFKRHNSIFDIDELAAPRMEFEDWVDFFFDNFFDSFDHGFSPVVIIPLSESSSYYLMSHINPRKHLKMTTNGQLSKLQTRKTRRRRSNEIMA